MGFLVSCGYQWQDAASLSLSVPFVEGDSTGKLTNALIAAIDRSPYFGYRNGTSHNALSVRVQEKRTEIIGFQKKKEPISGEIRSVTRPNEHRDHLTLEVRLVSPTGRLIWGPEYIEAFVDYDYFDEHSLQDTSFIDRDHKRQASITFSLGELEGVFQAEQDASIYLYEMIAQKIVDRLSLKYDTFPR